MSHDLSRKQFLSLGVVGGLGLLGACTLDDTPPKGGSGGEGGGAGAGSTTSTTMSGSGGSGTPTTSGSSGSAGSTSSTSGSAGSGGTSNTGGATGSGGSSGATGSGGSSGSAGNGGSSGSAGTGGTGGSKDAGPKDASGDAGCGNPVAAISMNHSGVGNGPHYISIPMGDVTAGVDMIYKTSSTPGAPAQGHVHSIKLTAADFTALRAGMTVTKHSCDANHEHQFAFRLCPMASVPVGTVCKPTDTCGAENGPQC